MSAALCILVTTYISTGSTIEKIPDEAALIISKIHHAAARHDLKAIRRLMISEFVWSYGGDGDADQAVAAWRQDRNAIHQLAVVTKGRCSFVGGQKLIQCPPNAGTAYRAGFIHTDYGWRMSYFVAGD